MRLRVLGMVLVFCLGVSLGGFAEDWHAPSNAPEMALDRILKAADADGALLDNLLAGRGKKGFKPSVDYAGLVTPAFLASVRSVERQLVRENCKGRYTDGICGLDYSPVSCSQDSSDGYLYRTLALDAHSAVVRYIWPSDKAEVAEFRLVEAQGTWRLDGVRCLDLKTSFHMN
jgi:hypothetical protein